jgi:hypothetical protein
MKKVCTCFLTLLFVFVAVSAMAQEQVVTMGLNGATGIYSLPTGRVSWYGKTFGFNVGYHLSIASPFKADHSSVTWPTGHTVDDDTQFGHLIGVNFGFLKWFELSAAFDIQPSYWTQSSGDNNDLIIGAKFQLPFKNASLPAIAVGGNLQFINMGGDDKNKAAAPMEWNEYANTAQIYGAATYTANFFNAPVETTVVLGKTFVINENIGEAQRSLVGKTYIDFGMGFDAVIFPKVLQNYVHWITDFSNFAYSNDPVGANDWRAMMNTGLRIDLSQIPSLDKFNVTVDIMGTDLLDHKERGFSMGVVFGMPIM